MGPQGKEGGWREKNHNILLLRGMQKKLPVMKMKLSTIATILLILAAFAASLVYYQQAPEQMVTHWNASGEPNGYMPKFWALIFTPMLMAMMAGLLYYLPFLDPLKKNVDKFRGHYENFIAVLMGFLLLVHTQTLLWNSGVQIDPGITVSLGMGVLMFYIGFLLSKAKQNWFIGIRTPWTLSSEKVWDKTHALGSKMFMAAGILVFIGTFVSEYRFLFVMVSVLIAAIVPVIYSYFEFRKLRPKA
jgi:uncharacterized membrane protein